MLDPAADSSWVSRGVGCSGLSSGEGIVLTVDRSIFWAVELIHCVIRPRGGETLDYVIFDSRSASRVPIDATEIHVVSLLFTSYCHQDHERGRYEQQAG